MQISKIFKCLNVAVLPVALAVATLGLSAATTAVSAQTDSTIRILVGFPPGAGTDNLARLYAEALTEQLGVTTIVENKPGAGGQIAAQNLKQATAQSNSLLFAMDHQIVMLPLIMKNPGFSVKDDMKPVGRIVNVYTCLAVSGTSPIKTLDDFVKAAGKDPVVGNVGIPAVGSQPHFLTHVLSQKYNVPLVAIPYRGAAPAISDLIGAQVSAAIVPCDALVEYKRSGRVRVLAAASDNRYQEMPDVPTFGEFGLTMPADSFLGVYAARTLKPELYEKVVEATRKMFESPQTVAKFASTLMEPAYASPAELDRVVEQNTAFWAEQVRSSNFQAQ